MAGPSSRVTPSSTLFSIVYLALLFLILLAFGWGGWSWYRSSIESADSGEILDSLKLSDAPTSVQKIVDIQEEFRRNMTPNQTIEFAIRNQLRELERFIRSKTSGRSTVNPTWVSSSFSGVGIDPKQFNDRLKDSVTHVSRYVQSETAPKFKNNRAFEQFIANLMMPLIDCAELRVNLRLDSLKLNEGNFEATVLAVSAGSRRQSKEEWEASGRQQVAIQTSSIWKTKWTSRSTNTDKYRLDNVTVSAVEKVKLSLNSPRLFVDCSASILADCESLKQQLVFGMDQWADKLPGIDVSGDQGIAIGDVNGDRLDDIYVCQPHGLPNLLLVQNKDATADDDSANSHTNLLDASRAALIIDIDNDGDQDLAVATNEALLLLSNDGRGKFQVETKLTIARRGLSLSAADFDNDGDLDLFLCRKIERRSGNRLADRIGGSSILLRNDEAFQFSRVELDTELPEGTPFSARAAVWHDRDLDGDQDLDVASEKLGTLAFENRDGQLVRLHRSTTETTRSHASSLSVGDFNGDGRSDLFVANRPAGLESFVRYGDQNENAGPFFLKQPLFFNQFSNTSAVFDANNDGLDDLFVGNGGYTRVARNDVSNLIGSDEKMRQAIAARLSINSRQQHRCFLSIGSRGFAEMSSASGLNYPEDARAAATTDWDHDGDMDLVVLCRSSPQIRIFINALGNRNSITFRLHGKQSNRNAVGARVEVYFKNQTAPLVKVVQAGNGCHSQSSTMLHFGIGSKKREIESAVVYWPSGLNQTFAGLSAGTNYDLTEGDNALVALVNNRFNLKYRVAELIGNLKIPALGQRVMVSPRIHFPGVEVQAAKSKWSPLKLSDERSTVVLLWDRNSESDQALSRLDRLADDLEASHVDVVTLFLGGSDLRPDEIWKYLSTFSKDLPGIKNWLSLSEAGREQLKITCGHLFSKLELPQTPLVLLLDRQQKIAAIYPAEALKNGILSDDIVLVDRDIPTTASDTLLGGIWAGDNNSEDSKILYQQLMVAGYPDAASILEPSLTQNDSALLTLQAQDLLSLGQFSLAKRLCDEAVKIAPSSSKALLVSSDVILQQTIAEAVKFPIVGSASLGKAKEQYERALELAPKEWRAAIGIAKLDLMLGNTRKAKTTLEDYMKRNSEQPEVQAMMGRICFQLKDYEQAKRYLGFAHSQRPALPYLKGDLGYLYMVTNEKKAATLKLLRAAHEQQPSDEHFFVLLAQAEFIKGNFAKAVDLYQQVTERIPNQIESKNVLAWLLATCPYETKRNGSAALELLAPKSEDLKDKKPATLEIYAACFAEVGDFERAIEYQQQAVDKSTQLKQPAYSDQQRKGMLTRLEMYRAQKPYRMVDASQTPVAAKRTAELEFSALRF